MKPEEIRYLLGGYASGTLSEEERRVLFAAALQDQELFDSLADEHALKEVLDDPESRGYLQAALEETSPEEKSLALLEGLAAPASAPVAAVAPIPRSAPPPQAPGGRRIMWGLISAAVLAAVTIVGLLRWNGIRQVGSEQASVGSPAIIAPAPVPSGSSSRALDAPKVPPANARRDSRSQPPEPAGRKEAQIAAELPMTPPPPVIAAAPSPTVSPLPGTALPPPASPAFQSKVEVTASSSDVALQKSVQVQDSLSQSTVSARQLYFAGAGGGASGTLEGAVAVRSAKQKKATAPAPAQAPRTGFAMRYRVLRKSDAGFLPVLPGTRFAAGDEVVLVVQKNDGGTLEIRRADTLEIVPMSGDQTAPLPVTAGLELIVTLSREGASSGSAPASASQVTEIGPDGMTYVAEPAIANSRPLVVRVPLMVRR